MAKLLALEALLYNSSFNSSNCLIASSSCEKTLTTFSPVMVSSMKPLSLPRLCCWATKFLPDREVTLPEQSSITPTIPMETQVRGGLRISIIDRILTTVIRLLSSWGILWLIIWRRVSISFV